MRLLASLGALCLLSCASLPILRPADSRHWEIVESKADPAADQLAEKFYSGAFEPAEFASEVDAALAADPASGLLHELAGALARLSSDTHASWRHYLLAALDANNLYADHDLREANTTLTVGEEEAWLDALRLLQAKHPDPKVQARATIYRAEALRLFGRFDEADAETEKLRFISSWQLIGAFDNEEGRGFNASLPPEKGIDLTATIPGVVMPLRWRPITLNPGVAAVPLEWMVSPSSDAIAYLATYIQSYQELDAYICIDSPAPLIAWLNDGEIVREEHLRGGAFDNLIAPIHLHAGWNKLLIKSANKKGFWNFSARLTDATGNTLSGVQASNGPHPYAAATPSALHLPALDESARGLYIYAAVLNGDGLLHESAERFTRLIGAHPENPWIQFATVAALREDSQAERALDLITAAIDKSKNPAPALLLQRAQLYSERSLYDQAEADLERAVDLNPQSQSAQLQLAALLSKRGWTQDACTLYFNALQRWPDSTSARLNLAGCLLGQGHVARAQELLLSLLSAEPGNHSALTSLKQIASEQLDVHKVLSYSETLRKLSPYSEPQAMARADFLRSTGDYKGAVAELVAISQQDPDSSEPYQARARIAEEMGQPHDALALWEEANVRDPNNSAVAERLEHLRPHLPEVMQSYVTTSAQIDAIVRNAGKLEKLPGSQIARLLDEKTVQLNADGSSKEYSTRISIALTQNGRDQLIQARLPAGHTKVLLAYAVQSDGSRQEASSITRSSVRFRKLEVGSIVVLKYIVYAPKETVLPGEYYNRVDLTSFSGQEEHATFTLLTPKGRALAVEASPSIKQTTTVDGDWDVRRFAVDHVPAQVAEAMMPPAGDLLASVVVTTLSSWDKFVDWEKAILLDSFRPDPQVKALAGTLTDGAKSPQEKVDRLYKYVAQEIRYQQEYETITAGWQPHANSVVLERKYGDCKDKATLLIMLLREVGIDAEFVVLRTHSFGKLPTVTTPSFNHAIVYIPAQKDLGAQFVDTTVDALDVGNLRADDQGAAGLVLNPKTGAFRFIDIPYQAPKFQATDNVVALTIDSANSARAADSISFRGSAASSFRTTLRDEVRAQKAAEHLANYLFPLSTLDGSSAPDAESIDHPLTLKLDIDLTHAILPESDHWRLKIPSVFGLKDAVALGSRVTPLDLRGESLSTQSLTATLPEGMRFKTLPQEVHVKASCFDAVRTVHADGRTLVLHDQFEQRCVEISPADYPAFRAEVEKAAGQLDDALVFEQAPAGGRRK